MEHRPGPSALRPAPQPVSQSARRPAPFSLTPLRISESTPASSEPSPSETTGSSLFSRPSSEMNDGARDLRERERDQDKPHKTRSILNLTSPTLSSIYSPTGYGEEATPFGTGTSTPVRKTTTFTFSTAQLPSAINRNLLDKKRRRSSVGRLHAASENTYTRPVSRFQSAVAAAWRGVVLFSMGIAYGEFVSRLHDTTEVAPVQVDGIQRKTWGYLIFWGCVAVGLGTLLPWVDRVWRRMENRNKDGGMVMGSYGDGEKDEDDEDDEDDEEDKEGTNSLGADWNPIVRTIGAFVGIAFAIRRLPWQSTLQVSLTLALVNPVIWYLIDRSKAGFALSSAFGISGAAALLGINPDIVPSPATPHVGQALLVAGLSYETIGVATWISSVLFCSSVCFGNLGRRLSRDFGTGER